MKLSKVAQEVIRLAEAVQHYWDVELPKRHPNYPLVGEGEDSGPPPPEAEKLETLLRGLPEDIIYKLLLLMHLGRGEFGTDALADNYRKLRTTFRKPKWAADRLVESASLDYYLSVGLEALEKAGIDVDDMDFKAARARK